MSRAEEIVELFALRDLLHAQFGKVPQSAQSAFISFRDQWGAVEERRLWRALQWLVCRGKVSRVGQKYHPDSGYVLAGPGTETLQDQKARYRSQMCVEGRCISCQRRASKRAPWDKGRCASCYREAHSARMAIYASMEISDREGRLRGGAAVGATT